MCYVWSAHSTVVYSERTQTLCEHFTKFRIKMRLSKSIRCSLNLRTILYFIFRVCCEDCSLKWNIKLYVNFWPLSSRLFLLIMIFSSKKFRTCQRRTTKKKICVSKSFSMSISSKSWMSNIFNWVSDPSLLFWLSWMHQNWRLLEDSKKDINKMTLKRSKAGTTEVKR